MKSKVWWCLGMLICCHLSVAQPEKNKWVDSVFQTLSLNEKLGQLFLTRISAHLPDEKLDITERLIDAHRFGGVILTGGSLVKQALLTNRLQADAQVPLLISQDAAAGLGMVLDSALRFPMPLAQAAMADDTLIYLIGRETARQMKLLGIHLSLSAHATPVHSETVSADMTYGSGPAATRKALLHMKGLQDGGVLSGARYFPLKSIEVIDPKGKAFLKLYHDTLVSYPYKTLFQEGLQAVIPDVTDLHQYFEPKKADLKRKISEKSLRDLEAGQLLHAPMNFSGMVLVDVPSLKHATDKFEPGDAELFAFQAGADLLIVDEAPMDAMRKLKKLLRTEDHYQARLDQQVRKILALKYEAGLNEKYAIDAASLESRLHTTAARTLHTKSLRASVTVLRDTGRTIPVRQLEDRTFACLLGGPDPKGQVFYEGVRNYVPAHGLVVDAGTAPTSLAGQHVLIAALFPSTPDSVLHRVLDLLRHAATDQQVIIADFGCKAFQPFAAEFPTVITGYMDDVQMVRILPQVIFGGLSATGTLAAPYGDIPAGTSVQTAGLKRLAYSLPEDAGIDGNVLERIEVIAAEAISSGATPGCHVLVARAGKVVYDRSFGHLTYDRKIPVTAETVYDLASLTKVSATLQAVMFMQEKGLIDIYKKLSVYIPELRGTNKKNIIIKDVLTHQSGLAPFIPLWPLTVEGPSYLPNYYNSRQSVHYPLQVSPTLFASSVLVDSVWSWISYSKMMEKAPRTSYPFRYSDLGFMMFKSLSERILNQPMEDFLLQNLYEPLGAYSLGYNPLRRFPAELIAPTELDTLFRRGLVIGTVHDERAAMLGGVSGHAGLFGTARDLSKIGQMLLQKGYYGGQRFFREETIELFTARQHKSSRRGLGWDKPVVGEWNSPTSIYASPRTFGHTGFTGTCLWVDPEFDLVYVFLSNRVFPDRNDKLIKANIRSRIQDVIYQAIFDYCKANEEMDFSDKLPIQ